MRPRGAYHFNPLDARVIGKTGEFESLAAGVYAQDLVQVAPHWKVLAGLRYDGMSAQYDAFNLATNAVTNYQQSIYKMSNRFGVLFQPSDRHSFHLSYGTSFNTSGDAYQYDAGTANVDPEKSRNIELGGRIESEDKRFSTRFALFHSTKYNERNRDADTVNACNYVLSGKRHAAGHGACKQREAGGQLRGGNAGQGGQHGGARDRATETGKRRRREFHAVLE